MPQLAATATWKLSADNTTDFRVFSGITFLFLPFRLRFMTSAIPIAAVDFQHRLKPNARFNHLLGTAFAFKESMTLILGCNLTSDEALRPKVVSVFKVICFVLSCDKRGLFNLRSC